MLMSILVDGCKQAQVCPSLRVNQGCPLSPLLFRLAHHDVDCLAENAQGAVTGNSEVRVMYILPPYALLVISLSSSNW
eukprot:scaffold136230_cov24-Tisochrysis_lutea.AAC.1